VPQSFAPIRIVDYDPSWPALFARAAAQVAEVLGARAIRIEHVGSTSVPGLAAKPIVDIDLIVADPDDEDGYLPALVDAGWIHTIREPWWYRHRMLQHDSPRVNLHVWGPDSPESWRHLILRDHLRRDADDRARYEDIKRESAHLATANTETVDDYNRRKSEVLREIILRALTAAGV
jgi:GrpB-like predicted nucleotidyltransferase (UPF0157 family)